MPHKKDSLQKHRKFFAYFVIALLAIIVPFTILISQESQEMRQRAQVPGITPVHFSVSIEQLGFSPATLTVPQGAIVTWINHDTVPHTTTSSIQGTQDSWDSHGLASAQIFSQQFVTPGTYPYRCVLHPQHQGTIIVQATGNISTPTPTKTTTIAPTAAPTSPYFPTPTVYCLGACLTTTPGGSAYPTYSYTGTPTPSSSVTTSPAPTNPNETPQPTSDPLLTENPTPTDSSGGGHNGGNGNNSSKGLFALLLGILLAILEFIFTLLGKK